MKNIIFLISYLLIIQNVFAQKEKTEILILGTTHFFSIKDDSITSPKKQKELKQLLANLKTFNPQQIFVENPSENDGYFLKIQKEITESKTETKESWIVNNEIYQVGIKLAETLKLSNGVQGIDWADPNTQDTTMVFKNNYEKLYFNYIKELRAYALDKKLSVEDKEGFDLFNKVANEIKPYFQLSSNVSLGQMLLFFNRPDNLKKVYYLNRLGNLLLNTAGVGAELNNIESLRDYKIYRNALNRIEKKTKRVLIIYGGAHAQILKELFDLDPRYKVLEVSKFVK